MFLYITISLIELSFVDLFNHSNFLISYQNTPKSVDRFNNTIKFLCNNFLGTIMANLIYEQCIRLFSSEDSQEQSYTYDVISEEINQALKTGNDSVLAQALQLAEEENKVAIFNHINGMINLSVSTMSHPEYDSHLFVFPIILQTNISNLVLPAIKDMEEIFRKNIDSYNFTTVSSDKINFAPVVLGKKAVLGMNMVEWHKIHRATIATLNNRSSRAMYEQPFSIQVDKDNASLQLFFLAFTVITEKDTVPEFFNPQNIDQDVLFTILADFERYLKRQVIGSDWAVLPFGTVNDTISNAFDFYQLLLSENLISQYSQNYSIHFTLVPTNNQNSFVLMAWNKETNNVLSALILNPYSKNLSDVVSDVMDLLNKYYIEALYIGDQEIPVEKFENLTNIDFASYLKKYGASVLKPQ